MTAGLCGEDFEAYLPERWSNNRYNLNRMKAKDSVVKLAQAVAEELDCSHLTLESSSEIPSVWNGREVRDQWTYFFRAPEARRALEPVLSRGLDLAANIKAPGEYYRHVLIYLRLDYQMLEVGLRISRFGAVDLANLVGRAEADRVAFDEVLSHLDSEFCCGDQPVAKDDLLFQARQVLAGHQDWFVVARKFEREVALSLGDQLVGSVKQATAEVEPLFRFILWTAENDHVGVVSELDTLAGERAEAERAREAAREEKKKAHIQRAEKARARTSAKVEADEAWRRLQSRSRKSTAPPPASAPFPDPSQTLSGSQAKPRKTSVGAKSGAPSSGRAENVGPAKTKPRISTKAKTGQTKAKTGQTKAKPKPSSAGVSRKKKAAPIFEKGEMCRLTRGLFAGKEGVVQGSEKPGYYGVRVGQLEVNVSAYDLEKLV